MTLRISGSLRSPWLLGIAFLLGLVAVSSAETDLGVKSVGPRAGVSVDPDQFLIGAQADLGTIVEQVRFIPNFTFGFGDDLTILAISPDVVYEWPVPDIGALYAGGLLTMQWLHYDLPEIPYDPPPGYARGRDDSDTEIGLHGVVGLSLDDSPLFFEAQVGIDDAPDLKAVVGYRFIR